MEALLFVSKVYCLVWLGISSISPFWAKTCRPTFILLLLSVFSTSIQFKNFSWAPAITMLPWTVGIQYSNFKRKEPWHTPHTFKDLIWWVNVWIQMVNPQLKKGLANCTFQPGTKALGYAFNWPETREEAVGLKRSNAEAYFVLLWVCFPEQLMTVNSLAKGNCLDWCHEQ